MTGLNALHLNEYELLALRRAGIVDVESLAKIDCRSLFPEYFGTAYVFPITRLACIVQEARWILAGFLTLMVPGQVDIQLLRNKVIEFYSIVAEIVWKRLGIVFDYERREAYRLEEEEEEHLRRMEESVRNQKQCRLYPVNAQKATALYRKRKQLYGLAEDYKSVKARRSFYEELWSREVNRIINAVFYDGWEELEGRGITCLYNFPPFDNDVSAVLRKKMGRIKGSLLVKLDGYFVKVGDCSWEWNTNSPVEIASLIPPDYVISNFPSLLTTPNNDAITLVREIK